MQTVLSLYSGGTVYRRPVSGIKKVQNANDTQWGLCCTVNLFKQIMSVLIMHEQTLSFNFGLFSSFAGGDLAEAKSCTALLFLPDKSPDKGSCFFTAPCWSSRYDIISQHQQLVKLLCGDKILVYVVFTAVYNMKETLTRSFQWVLKKYQFPASKQEFTKKQSTQAFLLRGWCGSKIC